MFKSWTLTLFILTAVSTAFAASGEAFASSLAANMYSSRLSTAFDGQSFNKEGSSNFTGDLSMRNNQLVEQVGEVVGNQYWGDLNMEYNAGGGHDLIKKFSAAARVNNEEQVLFSIPEAYLKYEWDESALTFGRSVLEWGYIDALWGFGKINNRKNFDYYEPGLEGLTGVLFQRESNGVSFSLFGSVLYIPEMNPGQNYDEDKGTITCSNPWCRPQAQSAPIDGDSEVPIFYDIEYPDITDVIFRYSAGARFAIDMGVVGFEAYGIRKPENQVSVMAEYYYENERQMAFVDVTPQVYYHDVLGGNIKVKLGDQITAYGGGMSVAPNTYPDGINPRIVYTGLKPEKKKEDYLGGGAFYENDKLKAGIHYIARVSPYDMEDDLLAEYPRWNQAYNINISSILTRKLSVAFDYKYDMLTEDRITMFSASYAFAPNMFTSAGVNMIGTSDDVESFWSDFSNNDSVYGSLKYLF